MKFNSLQKLLIIALSVLVVEAFSAQINAAQSKVKYSLEITDAAHHLAEVTVLFPKTESSSVDFVMPAWRLGKYKILNLANGLRNVTVTDASGNQLEVHKTDKNTWHVKLDKPSKLAFSYQLYANELSSRTRHIDETHAYLDGVSSFIYSPEFIDTALEVKLDVPEGWRSQSGLERLGKHSFKAESYHVLASSPIETGLHEYYSFKIDGLNYELVIWGKGNFDGQKIVDDYKKMVVEHGKLWGGYPIDRYLFIVHSSVGARGATEHINSTVIQKDALSFADKKGYASFLSISSHEFIHTWNVKAYRPVGIQQYNYTEENYSDLLWITEGSTSYFSDILLVRAGLLKPKDYLKALAKKIKSYQDRPGHNVMTAQQSSFDAWIEGGGDRARNSSVSIYSKGNLLSLLMDVNLLSDTGAGSGFADLHRLLYERFPVPEKGFSSKDIQDLLTEISGKDYTDFWSNYVESTAAINFEELFASLGLELVTKINKDKEPEESKLYTGLKFSIKSGEVILTYVTTDSPAWRAGMAVGDQLLAINGIKVVDKKFDLLMKKFKLGDEVKVSYFRRNLLAETTMVLAEEESPELTLIHLENATELQKKMYTKWLGVAFPENMTKSELTD